MENEYIPLLQIHADDVLSRFPDATEQQVHDIINSVEHDASKSDRLFEVFWTMVEDCGDFIMKGN